MSDVFRPLYVLVEAVEAEARCRVPVPRAIPLPDVLDAMRRVHGEHTLEFQRLPASREILIGHRCKVCREGHATTLSEEAIATADSVSELLAERVRALLEAPCPDLGLRGVS